MLIEVLISSLLVALIAVATFNGFDVTQKVTADERATTRPRPSPNRTRSDYAGCPCPHSNSSAQKSAQ